MGDLPTLPATERDLFKIVSALRQSVEYLNTNLQAASGHWTPAIAGSSTAGTQTYSEQHGHYFKIGQFCFVQIRLVMTAKDAATAGNIRITGLPFAAVTFGDDLHFSGLSVAGHANWNLSAGMMQLTLAIRAGVSYAEVIENGDNVANANILAAGLSATSTLTASGVYAIE